MSGGLYLVTVGVLQPAVCMNVEECGAGTEVECLVSWWFSTGGPLLRWR